MYVKLIFKLNSLLYIKNVRYRTAAVLPQ